MNSLPVNPAIVMDRTELEKQLRKIRHESLIATRGGDFRKVAELTRAATRLKQEHKAIA